MTMIVTLTMTRPDTTHEFWWRLPDNEGYDEMFNTTHEVLSLDVVSTVSEDELTMTRVITAESEHVWRLYMDTVHRIGPLLSERNQYCLKHGHSLKMVKNNLVTKFSLEKDCLADLVLDVKRDNT